MVGWDNVGSYRRALSSYDVKVAVVPLLAQAVDEATAFGCCTSAMRPGCVMR